jgi:hypothetical protein
MSARQIAIAFGIAVIFPLLIYYGVATLHPAPNYPTIVTANLAPPANPTPQQKKNSEEQRQKWQEQQNSYTAANKEFARIQAMVSVPLGLVAILIGAYLTIQAIGTGLIFGGILSVVAGYLGYWPHLDDRIRFISLLAGFLVLLFMELWKFARTRATRGST